MLQDTVTLSPCSQWNHFPSANGASVVGTYRHADGQFFLCQVITRETTFNLSISGLGVVKLKTFDNGDDALDWAYSEQPISSSCKRIRGGKPVSFQASFNGYDIEFKPFKPENVLCQDNIFTLPMKGDCAFLAFDIECGDVQVSITNFQVKLKPLDGVLQCSYSKHIKTTRVTMGVQFCRKSPAPGSLCKINGNVLNPDTVLYLKVDGPSSEKHTGSYFRLWVSRLKQSHELTPTQQRRNSDKVVQSSSGIITVEPNSRGVYMVVVKSNELLIIDIHASKAKSFIREPFDQHNYLLWVEFYRIAFSVCKTALVCDWFQDSEIATPPESPPDPPQIPRHFQNRCSPVSGNRGDARRRGSSQSDDIFDFSPPNDTLMNFSSSPIISGSHINYNINTTNSNTISKKENLSHHPLTISPSDRGNDSNNNRYRPEDDLRDFDPIRYPTGPQNNNSNSIPVQPPWNCNQTQWERTTWEDTVSLRPHGHFTEDHYADLLRESQRTADDGNYLSILSQSKTQSIEPQSSSQSFLGGHSVYGGDMRPVSKSAPIPCAGPKHRRDKNNSEPESTSLKKVAKKLASMKLKRSEKDGSDLRLGATAKDSAFMNEGFFDNDFETRSGGFENEFRTLLPANYNPSDMVRRTSLNNNSQPMAFSSENSNKSESGKFNNTQLLSFAPETNNTSIFQIPQHINNMIQGVGFHENNENNVVGSFRARSNSNNSGESDERGSVLNHRNSVNSSAKDSGVGVEPDGRIDLDEFGNDEDDGINIRRGTNIRRGRLSSYASDDGHHNTERKRFN